MSNTKAQYFLGRFTIMAESNNQNGNMSYEEAGRKGGEASSTSSSNSSNNNSGNNNSGNDNSNNSNNSSNNNLSNSNSNA